MQTAQQDQQTRVYQDSLQGPDIDTQDIMALLEQNQEYKEQNIDEVFDELEAHTWEQLGTDVLNDVIMTGLMFGTGALIGKAESHRLIEPVKQYKYNSKLSAEENIKKLQARVEKQNKYIQSQTDKMLYKGFSNDVKNNTVDKTKLKHINEKEYKDRIENISMQQEIMNRQQQEFKEILNKELSSRLEKNIKGTNSKLDFINKEVERLNQEINKLNDEITPLQKQINDKNTLLNQNNEKRVVLENNIKQTEDTIKEIDNLTKTLEKKYENDSEQIKKEIKKQIDNYDEIYQQIKQQEAKHQNIQQKHTPPSKKSSQIQSSLDDTDNLTKMLENADVFKQQKIYERDQLNAKYNQEKDTLQTQLNQLKDQLNIHKENYDALNKEIKDLSAQMKKQQNKLKSKELKRDTFTRTKENYENNALKQQYNDLNKRINKFKDDKIEFNKNDTLTSYFGDTIHENQLAPQQNALQTQVQNAVNQVIDKGIKQLPKQEALNKGKEYNAKMWNEQYEKSFKNLHTNQYRHRDQQMKDVIDSTNVFQEQTQKMEEEYNEIIQQLNDLDNTNIKIKELPHINDPKYIKTGRGAKKAQNGPTLNQHKYNKDVEQYLEDFRLNNNLYNDQLYTNEQTNELLNKINDFEHTFNPNNKVNALNRNELWGTNAVKDPPLVEEPLKEPKSIMQQYQDLLNDKSKTSKQYNKFNKQNDKLDKQITKYEKKLDKTDINNMNDDKYNTLIQNRAEIKNKKELSEKHLKEINNNIDTFLSNMKFIRDQLNYVSNLLK